MSRTRIPKSHSRLRRLTFQLTLLASVIMLYNLLWAHSRLTSSSSSVPDMTSAARIGFLNGRKRQRNRIENAIYQQHQQQSSVGSIVTTSFSATTRNSTDEEEEEEDYNIDDANDCLPPIQRLSDIRSCAMKEEATAASSHTADFWLHSMSTKCRQSIATWQDVQTCLMGRRRRHGEDDTKAAMGSSSSSIKHVHIIGERNSGTKFVTSEIQQCFSSSSSTTTTISTNNHSFPRIHRDFIRSKHFFQPILWQEDYSESFVIVVVRNPIDWVAAMRQHPYHSPCHLKGFNSSSSTTTSTGRRRRGLSNNEPVALEWEEFLNKPWTMPRQGEPFDLFQPRRNHHHQKANSNDLPITTFADFASTTPYMEYVYNNNSSNIASYNFAVGVGGGCTERFQTNEVVPCIYDKNATYFVPAERLRGYEPIYELKRKRRRKPSQRKNYDMNVHNNAYANILDLRADKIYNFVLELPLYMKLGGFLVVRYEDLLRHGTLPLLQQVASMVLQGNNNSTILGAKKQDQQQPPPLLPPQCRPTEPQPDRLLHRRAAIPLQVRTWIEQNINVETERLLGYYSDATQSLE